MEAMLWLIAGHFIGDFPFQSEWMATQKGKSWEVNLYHAAVYTATVFVVAAIGGFILSLLAAAVLLTSHFFIDLLKARWDIVKYIWLDQILHFFVLVMIALFFI